jgi:hypothetical protein
LPVLVAHDDERFGEKVQSEEVAYVCELGKMGDALPLRPKQVSLLPLIEGQASVSLCWKSLAGSERSICRALDLLE